MHEVRQPLVTVPSVRRWSQLPKDAIGLALLLGVALSAAAQQTVVSEIGANFDRCSKGLPSCQVNLLKPNEIAAMAENYHRRNLEACRTSSSACDPTSLSKADLIAVTA